MITLLFIAAALLSACVQPPSEDRPVVAGEPPLVTTAQSAEVSRLPTTAGPVRLRPDHPQTYTVRPGDSQLDIATRFLETPWRWPEVWRPAPGVGDIYPGDVIELYYEGEQPRLRLANTSGIVKLSPQVRVETLSQPIPTIPRNAIESFLKRTALLSKADWEAAPYIVGSADGRVSIASGDRFYVRGSLDSDRPLYRVFRLGQEYRHPRTNQPLGVAGIYVGDAVLEQEDDPATLVLGLIRREARAGDRLLPLEDEPELYSFTPHAPPQDTEGSVIALLDDALLISHYQSVVLDLGEEDGMEPGHVLGIRSAGRNANDPFIGSTVHLPDEKTGSLMVYKVHDRVSYGLVMNTDRGVRILDRVTDP